MISCGVLQTPQHGRKSTHRFDPGTKVEFYCDAGYILTGEGRRWCYESAEWNWAVWGEAQCMCKSSLLDINSHYRASESNNNPLFCMGLALFQPPQTPSFAACPLLQTIHKFQLIQSCVEVTADSNAHLMVCKRIQVCAVELLRQLEAHNLCLAPRCFGLSGRLLLVPFSDWTSSEQFLLKLWSLTASPAPNFFFGTDTVEQSYLRSSSRMRPLVLLLLSRWELTNEMAIALSYAYLTTIIFFNPVWNESWCKAKFV